MFLYSRKVAARICDEIGNNSSREAPKRDVPNKLFLISQIAKFIILE